MWSFFFLGNEALPYIYTKNYEYRNTYNLLTEISYLMVRGLETLAWMEDIKGTHQRVTSIYVSYWLGIKISQHVLIGISECIRVCLFRSSSWWSLWSGFKMFLKRYDLLCLSWGRLADLRAWKYVSSSFKKWRQTWNFGAVNILKYDKPAEIRSMSIFQ